jgi:hypothetical protein
VVTDEAGAEAREFEGETVEEGADGGWHNFDLIRCVALRCVGLDRNYTRGI